MEVREDKLKKRISRIFFDLFDLYYYKNIVAIFPILTLSHVP